MDVCLCVDMVLCDCEKSDWVVSGKSGGGVSSIWTILLESGDKRDSIGTKFVASLSNEGKS